MRSKLFIPSYSRSKVSLLDFSSGMNGGIDGKLADYGVAELTYNFSLSDGALKDGVGLKSFSYRNGNDNVFISMPTGKTPQKCYFYKRYDLDNGYDDRILVYADDNNFYECKLSQSQPILTLVNGLDFTSAPNSVCYKFNGDDVIIFSSEQVMKIYDGESVTVCQDVPDITSMCIHSERLFVTSGGEKTSLFFSDDFDPTNWYVSLDEAGFIDFQDSRGELLKVMSFNNYVYVFRDYGISRLTAYGDQTQFSATGLFLSSGKLLKNSIVDCGSSIIYLAEDGFYSFDGAGSTRIMRKLDKYLYGVANDDCDARYFDGSLYIALNMKLKDRVERVLICYNLSSQKVTISKGLRVRSIELVSSSRFCKPIFTCDNTAELGTLSTDARAFKKPLEKVWQSNFTDFNIDGVKNLESLSLYSSKAITIEVESDMEKKKIQVLASERLENYRVGVKGKTFRLKIISKAPKTTISKVILYFNHFRNN